MSRRTPSWKRGILIGLASLGGLTILAQAMSCAAWDTYRRWGMRDPQSPDILTDPFFNGRAWVSADVQAQEWKRLPKFSPAEVEALLEKTELYWDPWEPLTRYVFLPSPQHACSAQGAVRLVLTSRGWKAEAFVELGTPGAGDDAQRYVSGWRWGPQFR